MKYINIGLLLIGIWFCVVIPTAIYIFGLENNRIEYAQELTMIAMPVFFGLLVLLICLADLDIKKIKYSLIFDDVSYCFTNTSSKESGSQ